MPNKDMLFSFDIKRLEDLYVDCDDQTTISESLLKSFFNKDETNKHLLSILCENYSLNCKLKEQLEKWFDSMPIAIVEGKEVITVEALEAMLLEASIFTREEIKADLRKKFNISSHYN
jgi:hypothetical protein